MKFRSIECFAKLCSDRTGLKLLAFLGLILKFISKFEILPLVTGIRLNSIIYNPDQNQYSKPQCKIPPMDGNSNNTFQVGYQGTNSVIYICALILHQDEKSSILSNSASLPWQYLQPSRMTSISDSFWPQRRIPSISPMYVDIRSSLTKVPSLSFPSISWSFDFASQATEGVWIIFTIITYVPTASSETLTLSNSVTYSSPRFGLPACTTANAVSRLPKASVSQLLPHHPQRATKNSAVT